jgi:hypothetical protein
VNGYHLLHKRQCHSCLSRVIRVIVRVIPRYSYTTRDESYS